MEKNKKKSLDIYFRLWRILSAEKKKYFLSLVPLAIIAAFFEMISIGALIPFMSSMLDSEMALKNELITLIIPGSTQFDSKQHIIFAGLIFAFLVVLSGIIRLYLLLRITRFSFSTCAEISSEIYKKTLYQSYEVHISRNSSEIINGVFIQTNSLIYETLLPLMNLLVSLVLCSIILIWLIAINGVVTIFIFIGFGAMYGAIVLFTKASLNKYSTILSSHSTKMVKSVNEGLGGIRDVLLDGSQEIFYEIYQSANIPYRRVQAQISFIGSSPRLVAESIGMLAIVFITVNLYGNSESSFSRSIPLLAVIAFSFQKLLPLFQQIYYSLVSLKSSRGNLQLTLLLLEQEYQVPSLVNKPLNSLQFNSSIALDNVSFAYHGELKDVLSNINIIIKKGERIGIIGRTGCGKSTLIDLIIGLINPTKGFLKIDGEYISSENISQWHKKIAHVPQSIFLTDATIIENIALGKNLRDIDIARVHQVAEKAQISEFIMSLSEGYQTTVGERGVRLSGGQRQRIGIARALYKRAEIIIFDEATSALDSKTESEIMKTIYGLDDELTVLVVAHRVSTLEKCTRIIELHEGRVARILEP